MKLLNLCCGSNRPQDEFWWNLDNLHETLAVGTPERTNLDAEPRYIEANVMDGALMGCFESSFNGILASHCLEHWDSHEGIKVIRRCYRMLQPGGVLMVSVPDASYFRLMHSADTLENAIELFGEEIYLPDGEDTFMGYALWNRFHKAILTEDALWSYFIRAGFENKRIQRISPILHGDEIVHEAVKEMHRILNRRLFSLVMIGIR